MKHLFTFLCALMMILNANAAPQRNAKALLMQKQGKTQALQMQKQRKQSEKTTFLWGQKLLAKPAFSSSVLSSRSMKRSMRRTATNVTISGYSAIFYPATDEKASTMYYGLFTADWSKSFYFSIYTAEGKHDVELDKTYTLADMEGYASEWNDEEWNSHSYTEATFKKTKGTNYDVHIEATVTDADGNTFELKYDEEPVTITGNTVNIDVETPMTATSYSSDGTWLLRAENDNYQVQFSYYSADKTSCAGNFSGDNIDLYGSYININTGELDDYDDPIYEKLKVLDASYEVTETSQRIDAKGTILASNGNSYNVTMFYVKPHAETTATIKATNLEVNADYYDWFGEVGLTAADEQNSVKLTIYPEGLDEKLAGTYVVGQYGVDATVTPIVEGEDFPEAVSIYSGQFTVTYDAGNIKVTGTLLGYNNVEYTLDLSYTKPVATRQQTLTFPAVDLYILGYGVWQAIGTNADETQIISIAADIKESIAGTYTFNNLYPNYTYVVTDISGKYGKQFSCLDANLNVEYNEETKTAHITGTMLCQNVGDETDMPEFTVDVTASVPAPYAMDNNTADYKEDFGEYSIDTQYLNEGVIYVDVRNENDAVAALEFWVANGATTLTPGTYPINDTYQPNTVSMSEGTNDAGSIMYSFVGYANEQNQLTDIWFLVSGTVTIAENGVITIDALNSNGKKVNCVIGTTLGINSVSAKKTVSNGVVKHLEKGRLIIEKDGQRFNAMGIEMK